MTEFRIGEAAALLGVSDDTVRRWGESGKLRIRKADSGRQIVDGVDLVPLMTDAAAESPLSTAFPHARFVILSRFQYSTRDFLRDTRKYSFLFNTTETNCGFFLMPKRGMLFLGVRRPQ